ncbi:MAG: ABC transporter substrate-binding protein [Acidimicrobiia bacterium]
MHTRARRSFGILAALLAAVLLLASCGGDDDDGPDADEAESADVDPAGVLRLAYALVQPELKLDPIQANAPTEFWIHAMFTDSLLHQLEDGTYEPGLAEKATIVNPSTIRVELRSGLTFQDGTALDAEAAKFSILRNKTANQARSMRTAELSLISSIDVTSPTVFTINLSQPIAGAFYNLLAHHETAPISPAAVAAGKDFNTAPVGAGAFKFESRSQQLLKLAKWDGYYGADDVRLAGVEIIDTASETSTINALRTKTIDASPISNAGLTQVQGVGLETRTIANPDAVLWVGLQCKKYPALGDVRVRQALNFATDKDALNQVLADGKGEPMSQFFGSSSPYHDDSLDDVYEYDLDKAKKLLADAGHANLELSLVTSTAGGTANQAHELLQQQWAKAGITLKLEASPNVVQDYYIDGKMAMTVTPQTRFWTDKITRNFMPGSVGNTCDPQDPAFTKMVNDLRALDPGSKEAVALWSKISKYLSDNALGVWGIHTTASQVWNGDRIGDITWKPNQLGALYPDPTKVYIKK